MRSYTDLTLKSVFSYALNTVFFEVCYTLLRLCFLHEVDVICRTADFVKADSLESLEYIKKEVII